MSAAFWAFLAILFLLAASSSGQHILFGEFHQWSFFSPATILFGTIGLSLGALASRNRRLHERRTQGRRDECAEEILREAEASVNQDENQPSRLAEGLRKPSAADIFILALYACFLLITILLGILYSTASMAVGAPIVIPIQIAQVR